MFSCRIPLGTHQRASAPCLLINRLVPAMLILGKELAMKAAKATRMILEAAKAKDLMRSHPVSVEEAATIREAIAFLVDKGFSAAPVIDSAGRPVGVLSRSDILVH